ncbi:MAG: hypothetical protein A2268_09100 [Candidatus Raymondbacteria bacterium RifOxyA12_full_50_37]|uniref:ABC transmembrane type-1 domain-containing protein n=1 Tax=Candidatus Raymondbacteria bacterium RIFOXYD12_FULL_49_13 TaxID=1817890 RepID=A0A1F7F0Q1_UNCRA|nr:MAG: hypothetical protein A2268_09100 [Candidatus Raymondbacteria bacterium RifOxyA12_full_50_37]OGJ86876.1 MAG: hypothetical protein A2248_08155 [Candidatus Raymondbacteria bacterium RIFOXYA2_FULL_49_16]OGJ94782.1 MAG: hypothetical protein A2350_20670 [Candidatus Raymondbacteria bacterium RifOxyB12_full_50_8]OGJ98031.1 MAG: hypothetical protein A2487_00835 [Candidatus Raymondbacteria bacterium RifOxyC12_full_50_8]OGK00225.1 MAG: hypothetical protein A2519_07065 [Candidatus Raymondbacteria b
MINRILLYAVLSVCAAIMLTPMIWLLAAAFKGNEDLFSYLFFSPRPTLHNFHKLFESIPFMRYMVNSFFVSGIVVMLQLFFSSLGGFALAKYEFRGKKYVMLLMLITMLIPGQVLMAPLYELLFKLRLLDTYTGLVSPWAVSVFGMFLFSQSMKQIPQSLLEAGRLDGLSEFGIFWNLVLPVCRPMIGAFCLISFMGSWNNFLWPQIVLNSQEMYTLPVGLSQLTGLLSNEYGALMAGTLLAVLPVGVLFFLLQREFISGLTAGAVKG